MNKINLPYLYKSIIILTLYFLYLYYREWFQIHFNNYQSGIIVIILVVYLYTLLQYDKMKSFWMISVSTVAIFLLFKLSNILFVQYNINNDKSLFNFSIIVILSPFIEEIVFRNKLMRNISKIVTTDNWINEDYNLWGIFISTLIFVGLHQINNVYYELWYFILSFYLSYIRIKTNSIKSSIYAHTLWNLLNF